MGGIRSLRPAPPTISARTAGDRPSSVPQDRSANHPIRSGKPVAATLLIEHQAEGEKTVTSSACIPSEGIAVLYLFS